MHRPLVSVLIPTHNRQRYAVATARALALQLPECEIVVCDTTIPEGEVDSWQPLESQRLPNLKLLKRPAYQPISVVDNFNFAISQASGEFIVFIGDDDFVDRSIVAISRWAKNHGVEALRCTFPASYYWPDFKSQYFGDGYSAKISLAPFSGKVTEENPISAFKDALDDFGGGVGKMPRAYLGLLSADLIRRIEQKHGALFGGVSPDIYSAALIAMECRRCVSIDHPFIVPGSSGASTSGQSATGGHKGKLRDNDHIRPFGNFSWDARIPEFYSVPTVWSFSLLKAIEKATPNSKPHFGRLLARCFMTQTGHRSETFICLRYHTQQYGLLNTVRDLFTGLGAEMSHQAKRVTRRLLAPRATGTAEVLTNVASTEVAITRLAERLQHTPLTLPDLLPAGRYGQNE